MSLCLVADIGGTNGRFAINKNGILSDFQRFKCADFTTFDELLSHYLGLLNGPVPKKAVIAIASPVSSDCIELTNLSWSFSVKETAKRYQFDYLKVLNDFTAIAIAVPFLKKHQMKHIYGNNIENDKAKAVIGAGTGLGVSGILPHNHAWVPVQGQGGHVNYSPYDQYERELFTNFTPDNDYLSAEDVLSGRGLERLHKAVTLMNGDRQKNYTAADIVNTGINDSEKDCVQTLNTFSGILGAVAGDLAMTLGARGGVYIGGGVVNHMLEFFITNKNFRLRFEQRGCMSSYLEEIPIYVISDSQVGLLGALESSKEGYESIGITCSN
jgi:glucokinase